MVKVNLAGKILSSQAELMDTPAYSDCGGLLTEHLGKISNYVGPKTVCVWTIQENPGLHVALVIPALNLTCNKEYLEIQDGPPGSESYGKICEGLVLTFHSSSNIMTIKYTRKSDHSASPFDVYYYADSKDDTGILVVTTVVAVPAVVAAAPQVGLVS
ncbi:PREDICTED: carbohydrate-binding protein AQN-1-like [Ceratotherium simum simum]|uniref:Carbohydrate-binding protein AQN-1-like n=1 Tax=Ceratotherium simum simum TaxID=73337 RepID=A0ABM1DCK6_CERSS|nr:PREDICTED: carbohydrate-binding protein AQN-1-like [Ceratotherium simum simum]